MSALERECVYVEIALERQIQQIEVRGSELFEKREVCFQLGRKRNVGALSYDLLEPTNVFDEAPKPLCPITFSSGSADKQNKAPGSVGMNRTPSIQLQRVIQVVFRVIERRSDHVVKRKLSNDLVAVANVAMKVS